MGLKKIRETVCRLKRDGMILSTGIIITTIPLPFGATLSFIKHEIIEAPTDIEKMLIDLPRPDYCKLISTLIDNKQ